VRLRAHASVHQPGSLQNVAQLLPVIPRIDGLAAGSNCIPNCAQSGTLLLHWNGKTWSQVKSPDPGACNYLNGISVLSAANAWAVGQTCTFVFNTCHTLILHCNDKTWSQVASPSPGAGGFDPLTGVSADSAADAWAVGYYCTTSSCATRNTLTLRWNGTAWSKVASPSPGSAIDKLNGVTALSATDAWAVGADRTPSSHTLILHWNGTVWSQVLSPSPGTGDSLGDVAASATANAWAVGCANCFTAPGARALIEHWNGTAWSTTPG
jgi:hypothetical protein